MLAGGAALLLLLQFTALLLLLLLLQLLLLLPDAGTDAVVVVETVPLLDPPVVPVPDPVSLFGRLFFDPFDLDPEVVAQLLVICCRSWAASCLDLLFRESQVDEYRSCCAFEWLRYVLNR